MKKKKFIRITTRLQRIGMIPKDFEPTKKAIKKLVAKFEG